MPDDASDLAAHRITLAPAQSLDLFGEVVAIETVVGDRHRAQHHRLMLGPGVEIVGVPRSIRHGRHRLCDCGQYSPPLWRSAAHQSAGVGSAFSVIAERAARRVASTSGRHSNSINAPRMKKLSLRPQRSAIPPISGGIIIEVSRCPV